MSKRSKLTHPATTEMTPEAGSCVLSAARLAIYAENNRNVLETLPVGFKRRIEMVIDSVRSLDGAQAAEIAEHRRSTDG